MKHFDEINYSQRRLGGLSSQANVLGAAILSLAIIFMPRGQWVQLGLFVVPIIVLAILFKISAGFIFKRSLIFIPLVVVVAISSLFLSKGEESNLFWVIALLKSYLVMLVVLVALSGVGFSDLLGGLTRLKVPSLLIMLLALIYRYLFLLMDEAIRMDRARRARTVSQNFFGKLKTLGKLAGVLLLRAYERSGRVAFAMLSRGFDGHCRVLWREGGGVKDFWFLVAIFLFSVGDLVWAVMK